MALTKVRSDLQSNRVFGGSFTRDLTTASGTQNVTGVGFTPRLVFFFATSSPGSAVAQASVGMSAGTTAATNLGVANSTNVLAGTNAIAQSRPIWFIASGANQYDGYVSAFGTDGFTITRTKTGSPTGTGTVYFIAFE